MKFLDYTGLSRLTTNIKSYIASKLQPIDDRTPLYMGGMCYALDNAFLANSTAGVHVDMYPPVTLTPSSTGNAKKLYDRLAKGLPSALIVPVTSPTLWGYGTHGSWPFFPDPESTSQVYGTTQVTTIIYKCAAPINIGMLHDLKIVITRQRNNPSQPTSIQILSQSAERPGDNTYLLPYFTTVWSVVADGTISPAATLRIRTTSTNVAQKAFYNRMLKGFPPAIGIDITLSDGSTKSSVWLYLDSVSSSGTAIYKSGKVSNGTYSNYYFQINMAWSSEDTLTVLLKKAAVSA